MSSNNKNVDINKIKKEIQNELKPLIKEEVSSTMKQALEEGTAQGTKKADIAKQIAANMPTEIKVTAPKIIAELENVTILNKKVKKAWTDEINKFLKSRDDILKKVDKTLNKSVKLNTTFSVDSSELKTFIKDFETKAFSKDFGTINANFSNIDDLKKKAESYYRLKVQINDLQKKEQELSQKAYISSDYVTTRIENLKRLDLAIRQVSKFEKELYDYTEKNGSNTLISDNALKNKAQLLSNIESTIKDVRDTVTSELTRLTKELEEEVKGFIKHANDIMRNGGNFSVPEFTLFSKILKQEKKDGQEYINFLTTTLSQANKMLSIRGKLTDYAKTSNDSKQKKISNLLSDYEFIEDASKRNEKLKEALIIEQSLIDSGEKLNVENQELLDKLRSQEESLKLIDKYQKQIVNTKTSISNDSLDKLYSSGQMKQVLDTEPVTSSQEQETIKQTVVDLTNLDSILASINKNSSLGNLSYDFDGIHEKVNTIANSIAIMEQNGKALTVEHITEVQKLLNLYEMYRKEVEGEAFAKNATHSQKFTSFLRNTQSNLGLELGETDSGLFKGFLSVIDHFIDSATNKFTPMKDIVGHLLSVDGKISSIGSETGITKINGVIENQNQAQEVLKETTQKTEQAEKTKQEGIEKTTQEEKELAKVVEETAKIEQKSSEGIINNENAITEAKKRRKKATADANAEEKKAGQELLKLSELQAIRNSGTVDSPLYFQKVGGMSTQRLTEFLTEQFTKAGYSDIKVTTRSGEIDGIVKKFRDVQVSAKEANGEVVNLNYTLTKIQENAVRKNGNPYTGYALVRNDYLPESNKSGRAVVGQWDTEQDIVKANEELTKINNALNETENKINGLSKHPELAKQFSEVESSLTTLNNKLTQGKISIREYNKGVNETVSNYSKLVNIQQNRDIEIYNANVQKNKEAQTKEAEAIKKNIALLTELAKAKENYAKVRIKQEDNLATGKPYDQKAVLDAYNTVQQLESEYKKLNKGVVGKGLLETYGLSEKDASTAQSVANRITEAEKSIVDASKKRIQLKREYTRQQEEKRQAEQEAQKAKQEADAIKQLEQKYKTLIKTFKDYLTAINQGNVTQANNAWSKYHVLYGEFSTDAHNMNTQASTNMVDKLKTDIQELAKGDAQKSIDNVVKEMQRLGIYTDKAEQEINQLKASLIGIQNGKSNAFDFKDTISSTLNNIKQMASVETEIAKAQNLLNNSFGKSNTFTSSVQGVLSGLNEQYALGDQMYVQKVQQYISSLQDLTKHQEKYNVHSTKGDLVNEGAINSLNEFEKAARVYSNTCEYGTLQSENFDRATGKITQTFKDANGNITKVTHTMDTYSNGMRTAISETRKLDGFWGNLGKTFKSFGGYFATYFTGYQLVTRVISEFRQGLDVFKEYDSALTNVSYTMDVTKEALKEVGDASVEMATDLKTSISDAMAVSKIYANMKTTTEEMMIQAEPTLILGNRIDGGAETAADQIQSVLQQFSMDEEESMHIVDVYDHIAANIKMDDEKSIGVISSAVQAAGQVANDAGVSFEELAAISAKMAERTREDGGSIGNALKTMIVRTSKASGLSGADEVDNETLSKASKSLHDVGVEVYTTEGKFRDFTTILSELAEVWDTLNDAQQAKLLVA